MQVFDGKFIRYQKGGNTVYLSFNQSNLGAVRREVGGNYDVVEGHGVYKDDGTFDFYTSKEEIPALPLVVNGAGAVNEERNDETADPDSNDEKDTEAEEVG